MSLRIAFDMDGVLADFERAFRDVELRLFGASVPAAHETPESRAEKESEARGQRPEAGSEARGQRPEARVEVRGQRPEASGETSERNWPPASGLRPLDPESPRDEIPARRKLDRVWAAIEATPDFWTTLAPIDGGAVRRIRDLAVQRGWEVFFITQRPRTGGASVQRQTQRWLVEQGFDWPSVVVVPGSRGKAAAALHLDWLVDDSPKNCVDVISDSKARAVLVSPDPDERTLVSARRLGISVARSIGESLDLLEQDAGTPEAPTILGRLARIWR